MRYQVDGADTRVERLAIRVKYIFFIHFTGRKKALSFIFNHIGRFMRDIFLYTHATTVKRMGNSSAPPKVSLVVAAAASAPLGRALVQWFFVRRMTFAVTDISAIRNAIRIAECAAAQ